MKISIIGASGIVGSSTAFAIADQLLGDEIVLLGNNRQNLAASHAMDIQAATTGRKDMLIRPGKYADMAGSDIVIIAAGIHFPAAAPVLDKLNANIPIISDISSQIEHYCPDAIVITAANPVDLLNYAIYVATSLDKKQLIGFNLNDTTRFRMNLGQALGISATRIEAHVLGEHPRAPLLIFSSLKIDGQSFQLDEPVKNKVREELGVYLGSFEALKAGRSSGWTSASGITAIVRAIVENKGELLDCSAVVDGEYDYKGLNLGVSAIIGKQGIRQIVELNLAADERRELDIIAGVLKENSNLIRSLIGSKRA